MVKSILDTDLYKFSTSNAYFQLYPLAEGTFTFNDRAKEVYDQSFVDELRERNPTPTGNGALAATMLRVRLCASID